VVEGAADRLLLPPPLCANECWHSRIIIINMG